MARLFGLVGNRGDLAGRVLAHESAALRVRARGSPLGWGVGFYQGGEVLMRRRPTDEREEIDVGKLTSDLRADLLVGHVRSATVGALRTENTHPFRYRQWLFAQTGTIPSFDAIRERLVASVPEFLRAGIRGETDSEILFHVFLSFLHDAGRLGDGRADPGPVAEALRASLSLIDGMCAEVGGEPGMTNAVVTNGEFICALYRGAPMAYRVFSGKGDAEALMENDPALRRKTPELDSFHFSLVASDFDDESSPLVRRAGANGLGRPEITGWKAVAEHAIVTLDRGQAPQIERL